jgi:N4-(beta-N-acetylglucosaminyl)-L-asparaginase
MDLTDHHLLVGEGAQRFARQMGFRIEDDLNTENSRRQWLEWKRKTDPSHFPPPDTRYGTINCNGVNANGDVCGVTTTSGLAWKIPGRVGDSPILGAGLWVDNDIGAAGSTGRGEANLYNLSSFFIVQRMASGRSPKDAAIDALRKIKANTVDPRLLKADGNPRFNVMFYVVNKRGEYAGVSMYEGRKFAVCTENGPQTAAAESMLSGSPSA